MADLDSDDKWYYNWIKATFSIKIGLFLIKIRPFVIKIGLFLTKMSKFDDLFIKLNQNQPISI